VFTARYALSPYIKQIRFVFKGLSMVPKTELNVRNKVTTIVALAVPVPIYGFGIIN
jgi:hypothetical protein